MSLGVLTLHIHIHGCKSLKEKRGRLKPLIMRLRREFNISVTEMDLQDTRKDAVVACALISNDSRHTQRVLQSVVKWVENNRPDVTLVGEEIEII